MSILLPRDIPRSSAQIVHILSQVLRAVARKRTVGDYAVRFLPLVGSPVFLCVCLYVCFQLTSSVSSYGVRLIFCDAELQCKQRPLCNTIDFGVLWSLDAFFGGVESDFVAPSVLLIGCSTDAASDLVVVRCVVV